MPKISIIVPIYKTEKYLRDCLDSVLSQTFSDWELICVDDGSPDNSDQIVKEYASKDNRIHLIVQENKGLSGARNTGLDRANGAYIVFLDSDDQLPTYALELMYQLACDKGVPMVASRQKTNRESDKGVVQCQVYRNNLLKHFVADAKIHSSAWNKIYRADVLKTHRFIPGIYFEDWPFLMVLMGRLDGYAVTDTPCYIYRDDNASITRSGFNQKKVDSYLTGIKTVYDFYRDRLDLRQAQKRMAVAAKMMINKVYKSKDATLQHYAKEAVKRLLREKVIYLFDMPVKTMIRLWCMK